MRAFSFNREVRFGDCDPSGIAYFPAYLNILNGVVEEFWTLIGFSWLDLMVARGIATPTVHIDCDFVRPSRFGDMLTFSLGVGHVGHTSLRLDHVVASTDAIRWRAHQVLVATSMSTRRPLSWPDDVRDTLVRQVCEVDIAEDGHAAGRDQFARQRHPGHAHGAERGIAARWR